MNAAQTHVAEVEYFTPEADRLIVTTNAQYVIEVADDTPEADQFCDWLNENGHRATVGDSANSYINGHCTSISEEADQISKALWDLYCSQ